MRSTTSVVGPSRQAAFFGPTVANGTLRTWLDLQLAPPTDRNFCLCARRNRLYVIERITESLRTSLVGNRTDYMSAYIIFGPQHQYL